MKSIRQIIFFKKSDWIPLRDKHLNFQKTLKRVNGRDEVLENYYL